MKQMILLIEEILHQLIGSLSHYLQGFTNPNSGCLGFLNHQQYGSLSHDLPSRERSHILCGERNFIFNSALVGDMFVPRRLHFLGVQALISAGFSGLLSDNQLVETCVI